MTTNTGGDGPVPEGPWLIVGLGNPGPQYAGNRHNVGFMVADLLAERMGGRFKAHRSRAEVFEGRLGTPGVSSRRVVLAKPMSFMNVSVSFSSCARSRGSGMLCVYEPMEQLKWSAPTV